MKTNHMLIRELIQFGILKNKNTLHIKYKKRLQQNVELLNTILLQTSFLLYDAPINARLHCIINNIIAQPVCSTCGTVLKMRLNGRFRFTFAKTCGSKCFSSDPVVISKRKQTNLQKYGSSNFLSSAEGTKRRIKTLKEHYGVDNAGKIQNGKRENTIRERYGSTNQLYENNNVKRKQTMVERYGVKHAMHHVPFKQKQKQTCLKRYGVDNVWFNDEIQRKRKTTMIEHWNTSIPLRNEDIRQKFTETMVERYGVEHALQDPNIRQKFTETMVERYGVEHALQDPSILKMVMEKSTQTSLQRYGVNHPMQRIISPDSLSKLNDKNWLITQHHTHKYTLTYIATLLNVQHSTVGLYFKKLKIPVLTHQTSQEERLLSELIATLIPQHSVINNSKSMISPFELDIYIPDLALAFEYNGIFWHGEANGKTKQYHIDKTKACEKKGIRLIHIFETDWLLKRDIVVSRIQHLLKLSNMIYARKCIISEITDEEKRTFLHDNHIQGDVQSKVNLGLKYNGKLVSVMTFGKSRFSTKYEYELLRYANVLNHSVIGGASRLFKHFIKLHHPSSIITYSDKRWNTGTLYKNLNFKFLHTSAPNYFYFKPNNILTLFSRIQFQKHKLAKKLDNFNPELTEWQNMVFNGYDRIWDCGNDVWIWTNN